MTEENVQAMEEEADRMVELDENRDEQFEGRVVSGEEAMTEAQKIAAERLASDPWYGVALQCPFLISQILGAIDLQVRFGELERIVEVPTGEKDAEGKPILREVQVAEPDALRVQALAVAAKELIEVHDYAMRRRSKHVGKKGKR